MLAVFLLACGNRIKKEKKQKKKQRQIRRKGRGRRKERKREADEGRKKDEQDHLQFLSVILEVLDGLLELLLHHAGVVLRVPHGASDPQDVRPIRGDGHTILLADLGESLHDFLELVFSFRVGPLPDTTWLAVLVDITPVAEACILTVFGKFMAVETDLF